ncbi:MAG: thiamine-phosphate pyrophosphorylase [Candidatus Omnitrophota bacterium]|nr:MAG: thiamine-phosphate pyrophosphorylase [Candidatus Omnitrophota bacterium]
MVKPVEQEEKNVYRLLDANFNRAEEGLRVCEDIARLILEYKKISKEFKHLRHLLFSVKRKFPLYQLLQARDTETDVGRGKEEGIKHNWREILFANLARIKEAVRSLEEFSQSVNPSESMNLQEIRFRVYKLEKEVGQRI